MTTQRPSEHFRGLGETVAKLSSEEQCDFFTGFIAGHDRLANEIHQKTRGQENRRPVLHDKVARALTELRQYMTENPTH